ncbi:MAG: methyltransferase domain-containing protein [Planctomycetota bacterium]
MTAIQTKHQPHDSPFYRHLVPAYQIIWPAMAKRRMSAVISSLKLKPQTRVLEVGVGTGLSLHSYPSHIDLQGIDLSDSMLAEAHDLVRKEGWDHINLTAMDAENLNFDDDSFDVVTSFHTISVVSDPQRMMSEMVRVCRPGGMVLMINHFRSNNALIAGVVDRAGAVTRRLGWRTDLELDEVLREQPLRLEQRYKTNPFSLFTVAKATCQPDLAEA